MVGHGEAIASPQILGQRIAIVGAGGIGFDVAELLSEPAGHCGDPVEVVKPIVDFIAQGPFWTNGA